MAQKNLCPHCEQAITSHPALFSMRAIACDHCDRAVRTNLSVRVLFAISFVLLTAYYLLISHGTVAPRTSTVAIGLTAVFLPLIISIFMPRYEIGDQQARYSQSVNVTFYASAVFLLCLWGFS